MRVVAIVSSTKLGVGLRARIGAIIRGCMGKSVRRLDALHP